MRIIDRTREALIKARRARVLSGHLARVVPRNASVLNVGCGDGKIALLLQQVRPDIRVEGIDVRVREKTHIPVQQYGGLQLPYADRSYDTVMLIDVLHHASDPRRLLREAARATRHCIVIKDHLLEGLLAGATLRFMDRVGNRRRFVDFPHRFWRRTQWLDAFRDLELDLELWEEHLRLYGVPWTLLFDRSLHFLARLVCRQAVDRVSSSSRR